MNHERLKLAIDIIRDIPANQLRLSLWQAPIVGEDDVHRVATRLEQTHCGTIACAGGWLALHPQMGKLGLSAGSYYGEPVVRDEKSRGLVSCYYALAQFFDIRLGEAQALFYPRSAQEMTNGSPENAMTDKELWLHRMELFTADREKFHATHVAPRFPND
jgi:hypothetical protein